MSFSDTAAPELVAIFGDRVCFHEPLGPYLWYGVGGPADALVFPRTEEELERVSELAKRTNTPVTVVGRGTNLLVKDGGIRGIVVNLRGGFASIAATPLENGGCLVQAGGGVEKPQLLDWALERSLAGLEFSAGVPGSIGGGIFMNAGTKYGCYGDILEELRLFDFATGARTVHRSQAHFGYREQSAVREELVLSATFRLAPGDGPALRTEVERIIAERAQKQPLDYPSCGSTFKNPEGFSAGRLIEKAGLKGLRSGGAEVSLKHANFLLNKDNATASDILTLIGIIKERVFRAFGVALECEVVVLGEDPVANTIPRTGGLSASGPSL